MKQFGAAGRHILSSTPSVESLERRQLYAAKLGINVNNFGGDDYGNIVQMLHDSGTTDVRLWYGFDNYQERTLANVAKYAKKFHHDGFSVTLSVNPRKGRHGSYDETRAFFDWLANEDGMAEAVDLWEIGNEPDSQNYWKGTLAEYVSDYLAPASKALHAAGEKVVSGGVAWNPDDIKTLVDAGMLQYVDAVGYHPYRPSVPNLKKCIGEVESYVGGKPLIATEWNIRGKEDDKQLWAQGIQAFWEVIREHFSVAHYFAAVTQDSRAGPAGVLTESGKPNRPFYNVYLGLQNVGQPAPPVDNGGDGSGDDDGSKDDDDKKGDDDKSDSDDDDSDGKSSGGSKSSGGGHSNSGTKGGSTDGDGNASGGKSSDGDADNTGSGSGVSNGGSGTKTGSKTGTGGKSSTGSTVETPAPVPALPPPVPPEITGLSLLNASKDRVVKPYAVLSGAATIDLASIGTANLSFLASANKKTGSVRFTIGGNTVVDSDGVYTPFGDTADGNINGVDLLPNHMYVLTAQAFSGANATGTAGTVVSYVVNVINTSDPVNTMSPAEAQAAARRKAAAIARRNRLTPVTTIPGL